MNECNPLMETHVMFNTLNDAIDKLGEAKVLHNLNQFLKERAKRMEYNKAYQKQNRVELREYREFKASRKNFKEEFAALRVSTTTSK